MTDIQAAIGLVQLSRLDAIVAQRRQRAGRYAEMLAGIPGLRLVADPPHGTGTFQACWALLDSNFPLSRDELLSYLMERQISPRRGIMASHLEPAYADHPHRPLPNTERLTRDSVILPLYHVMTDDEQDQVVAAVRQAAGLVPEVADASR
jgi:dTDP-4-amino-4,6-dideoxygalactose transaminase